MKFSVLFCMQFIYLVKFISNHEIPKIAIVGSGIGGSSCSYFLRELLGKNVEIDVYEANQIGGRLATREYKGSKYEVGGCVIHERNKYMNDFREKFGLEKAEDRSGNLFAIHDEHGIEFISSEWKYLTYIKMFLRYGFSLNRLDRFVEKMLDQFDRIYDLQNQLIAFDSAEELMENVSPDFSRYFKVTTEDGLSNFANVNQVTINDLVKGSLRVNYGQSNNVHLFVGSVSVAGMIGSLWAIKGGNKQVPEKLIKESSANFINNAVIQIQLNSDRNSFLLDSLNKTSSDVISRDYDYVVIAKPMTNDYDIPIKFVGFPETINVPGKYHRTVSTIVSGKLNGSYFGINEKRIPDLIINNDVKKIVNSVGKIIPVNSLDSSYDVWKVFSQRRLTDIELDELFIERSQCDVVDWLAYPEYSDLNLRSSFVLHPRLYYVNAIEWAASAMEMSVIGAKNVALLIWKKLNEVEVNIRENVQNLRRKRTDEL